MGATRAREAGWRIRVIYFLRPEQGVIWMLTLYPKNVADSIPAHVLKQIREEIEDACARASQHWRKRFWKAFANSREARSVVFAISHR